MTPLEIRNAILTLLTGRVPQLPPTVARHTPLPSVAPTPPNVTAELQICLKNYALLLAQKFAERLEREDPPLADWRRALVGRHAVVAVIGRTEKLRTVPPYQRGEEILTLDFEYPKIPDVSEQGLMDYATMRLGDLRAGTLEHGKDDVTEFIWARLDVRLQVTSGSLPPAAVSRSRGAGGVIVAVTKIDACKDALGALPDEMRHEEPPPSVAAKLQPPPSTKRAQDRKPLPTRKPKR